MGKFKLNWNSKLGIFTTIVVLALILVGISERKVITKTAGLESLTDEEYVEYYKKACGLRDADACYELGLLYDRGDKDVSVDKENALTYYGLACELDNATACNNLAYLYNTGEGGVEKHNGYAFRYYKKSCDLGDMIGCYNLGSMYYHGEGTKPSKYRAKKLFEKVCDKGVGAGCNDLAYMYAHGIHVRKDIFEAISLYNDGCDYGEASACNNLANMYANGSLGVAKDPVKAEQYYSKACDLDDIVSCNKLASIKQITTKVDFEKAKKACKHNGATGCYKLGELYTTDNNIVKKDEDKALRLLTKACDLGQSQACKRIGDFHKNGNKF
jgi:TPR repeat protein